MADDNPPYRVDDILDKEPLPSRLRLCLDWLKPRVLIAQILVLFAMIASFFARDFWWADLFSHFYPQYMLAALAAFSFSLLTCFRALAVISLAAAAISYTIMMHSLWLYPRSLPLQVDIPQSASSIRIAHINYFYDNRDFTGLDEFIRIYQPDILNVQEVVHGLSAHITAHHSAAYPYQIHDPQDGSYGSVILSRIPILKKTVHAVNGGLFDNNLHDVIFTPRGQVAFRFLSLHGAQPVIGHDGTWQRNNELYYIAELIRKHKGMDVLLRRDGARDYMPILFVGDINMTPYSPFFRDVIRSSQQQFLGQGEVFPAPTWPEKLTLPLFQIQVDHMFYSPDNMAVKSWQSEPVKGSDHKAVIADFVFH